MPLVVVAHFSYDTKTMAHVGASLEVGIWLLQCICRLWKLQQQGNRCCVLLIGCLHICCALKTLHACLVLCALHVPDLQNFSLRKQCNSCTSLGILFIVCHAAMAFLAFPCQKACDDDAAGVNGW